VQKAITVYEIFEDGAAARDDRLMPGDQILEVSLHVCLSNLMHSVRYRLTCSRSNTYYRTVKNGYNGAMSNHENSPRGRRKKP
jgi:hypothetical protein